MGLTTTGDFPPSSNTHGLRYFAASAAMSFATAELPVNCTMKSKTTCAPF